MHSDRLVRIIDLKERLMEEKECELDLKAKERDALINKIKALDAEIDLNYSDLCTRCLDGNEFASIKDYLEHLGRTKSVAMAQQTALESQIAALRAALYAMLREIKMLGTLKEKRISAAQRVEKKKHQKLLDDIALRLEARKS